LLNGLVIVGRYWSWLEILVETTRRADSFPDTSSLPLEKRRKLESFYKAWRSHIEVYCQTFIVCCCQKSLLLELGRSLRKKAKGEKATNNWTRTLSLWVGTLINFKWCFLTPPMVMEMCSLVFVLVTFMKGLKFLITRLSYRWLFVHADHSYFVVLNGLFSF
jgi:hypothetical protein